MGIRIPNGDLYGEPAEQEQPGGIRLPDGKLEQVGPAPGFAERLVGGFEVGLYKDPIIGWASRKVNSALRDAFPGAVPELDAQVAQLEGRLQDSSLAGVAKFVGEWAPNVAGSLGMYALGRGAVKGVLKAAATRGTLGGSTGKAIAAWAADSLGSAAGPVAKPGAVRIAELFGGNLAAGAFQGAESLADSGDWGDALKAGGITAAIGGGFEGALAGAGALAARSRLAKVGEIRKLEFARGKILGDAIAENQGRLTRLSAQVGRLQAVQAQEQALFQAATAYPAAGPPGVTAPATALGGSILKRAAKLQKLERPLAQLQADVGILTAMRDRPLNFMDYTRNTPFNPNGKFKAVRELFRKAAVTPEGYEGRVGVSLTEALKDIGSAELELIPQQAAAASKAARMYRLAGQLLDERVAYSAPAGAQVIKESTVRRIVRNPLYKQLFDTWERDGMQAVEQLLVNKGMGSKVDLARELFKEADATRELFDQVVALGGEKALTPAEKALLGVRNFLPHVMEYDTDTNLVNRLAASFGGDRVRAAEFLHSSRRGLRHFGSIDHQRKMVGTLADKVGRGLPMVDDPIAAIQQYNSAVVRRLAYGKRFGIDGQLRGTIVRAAAEEGADPLFVTNVLDNFFNIKYHDAATEAFFRKVRNFETATKMPLAVIPNLSQPVNSALANGIRNTVVSSMQALSPSTRRNVLKGYGINSAMYDLLQNSFVEPRIQGGPMDRFLEASARMALRGSGFEKTEVFNRTLTALAASRRLKKDWAMAVAGRLRGDELNRARRTFRGAGLNLDDMFVKAKALAAKTGIGVEDLPIVSDSMPSLFTPSRMTSDGFITQFGEWDRALIKMVQQAQFLPGATRRPEWWNTPGGRTIFQFKNFALSQARFLRDAVLAEAAVGNMKPAATFLGIYPLVGEFVRDTQHLLRKGEWRDEENLALRFMDNVLGVGGVGIAGDALLAARWGRLTSWLVGPSATDAAQFAENLIQMDADGFKKQITQLPIYRATRALGYGALGAAVGVDWTARRIADLVDQENAGEEGPQGEAPTLQELQRSERNAR